MITIIVSCNVQEISWYVKAKDKMTDQIYHSEIQCYPAKYENTTFRMNFLKVLQNRVANDNLYSTYLTWSPLLVSGHKVREGKGANQGKTRWV